jgi:hypothetical protein
MPKTVGHEDRSGNDLAGIGDPVKSMSKPGTERAVVGRERTWSRRSAPFRDQSHLLGLVHAPVDQEVRCPSVIDVPTRRPAR